MVEEVWDFHLREDIRHIVQTKCLIEEDLHCIIVHELLCKVVRHALDLIPSTSVAIGFAWLKVAFRLVPLAFSA